MTLGNSQVMLLKVTEFARISQTTPRTIRFYEKTGLIKPVKIDTWNKYRYYSPEQTRQIAQIKLLQHFNIPLKEIRILLKSRKAHLSLRGHLQKLESEITKKQKEIGVLNSINEVIFEGDQAHKHIKKETLGPYQLFCLYTSDGDYHKIENYIGQLRSTAQNLDIPSFNSEITFFLDGEYKPKHAKMEIALVCKKIPKMVKDIPKNYYFKSFPKTTCLVFNFKGPYHYLTSIYKGLDKYMESNHITVKDHVFEQYVINPLDTHSPYDFLTKICYPI